MVLSLQVDGGRCLWRRGDRLEQAGQLGPDYQEYGVQRPHYFHQVESAMGLLQTDLPDQVKIWFIFRALPPPLQRQVALAPDGSPWATYDAF